MNMPREQILCDMTRQPTKVNVFASKGIFVISCLKIIKAVIFGDGSLQLCYQQITIYPCNIVELIKKDTEKF